MKSIIGTIVLGFVLLFASPSHAVPVTFAAFLDGPSENPPNASPGTGFAEVVFDPDTNTMTVSANFQGLLGTTTNAHIHCCIAPPGTAGVATTVPSFPGFPLGVTSGTFLNTFDTELASTYNPAFVTANGGTPQGAEAALFNGLLAGQAYFNIHTTAVGAGEIRGFLNEVPEPGTLGLLTVGLTVLAEAFRRRRT